MMTRPCRYKGVSQATKTIGIQVLYSGVLWLHPARVTCLHHHWGANEPEISFSNPWPGFEPRTSQSDGRKRLHLTTVHPRYVKTVDNASFGMSCSLVWKQVLPERQRERQRFRQRQRTYRNGSHMLCQK